MRVYDFDKTIYNGDSTAHFYKYCLRRKPSLILKFPIIKGILFAMGMYDKTKFKESFYKFLQGIDDVDSWLESFWDLNIYNMKKWYDVRQTDVIISASPEFLLIPICKRVGIKNLMASRVDKKTGKYTGVNCWGEEKVRRFYEKFDDEIDEFYSDSYSDSPLAKISKKSFLVDGDKLSPWDMTKC